MIDREAACARAGRERILRYLEMTGFKLPWRVSIIPSAAIIPLQSKTHSFVMEQVSAALRWEFR